MTNAFYTLQSARVCLTTQTHSTKCIGLSNHAHTNTKAHNRTNINMSQCYTFQTPQSAKFCLLPQTQVTWQLACSVWGQHHLRLNAGLAFPVPTLFVFFSYRQSSILSKRLWFVKYAVLRTKGHVELFKDAVGKSKILPCQIVIWGLTRCLFWILFTQTMYVTVQQNFKELAKTFN